MTDSVAIASALLIGVGGSTHCIGMCGGIGAALGMATTRKRWLLTFNYHLGRIVGYAALGGIVGAVVQLFGATLQPIAPLFGIGLRIIAGAMIIAMGLYIGGWWFGLARLERIGAHVWRHIQPLTKNLLPPRNIGAALTLGAAWGLLPCGLIYSTLSWAAARGNALESAQLMAVFGLGTLPSMILTTIGGQQIQKKMQQPWVRKIAAAGLIALGVITIAIPLQHIGGHRNPAHQHNHEAHHSPADA